MLSIQTDHRRSRLQRGVWVDTQKEWHANLSPFSQNADNKNITHHLGNSQLTNRIEITISGSIYPVNLFHLTHPNITSVYVIRWLTELFTPLLISCNQIDNFKKGVSFIFLFPFPTWHFCTKKAFKKCERFIENNVCMERTQIISKQLNEFSDQETQGPGPQNTHLRFQLLTPKDSRYPDF